MQTSPKAAASAKNEAEKLRESIKACLRKIVAEQADAPEDRPTIAVSQKPDATIQSTVVEIAKAAAYGMERIELLKKRDFPTHKSAEAVGGVVEALSAIFNDMLKNPMDYLDEDPEERVKSYEKELDAEEAKLG